MVKKIMQSVILIILLILIPLLIIVFTNNLIIYAIFNTFAFLLVFSFILAKLYNWRVAWNRLKKDISTYEIQHLCGNDWYKLKYIMKHIELIEKELKLNTEGDS